MIRFCTAILQYFVETSGLPRVIVQWIAALGLPPVGVIIMILLIYVILGCFLDSLSMMLITLPIVFPLVPSLGYDPIWFGVLVVSVVEIGLTIPRLGMNLFVIAAAAPNMRFETVALGVLPYLAADFVRVALLVMIPALSLSLPALLM
ncbi:TRAP transporter large permease subunit [uncultured Paracoccus sp.]|uniref:TRAP transporter large permease subunit n=1 Tax=uncultured Paracoccus sp. TaxID=189685 RepID=UPI0026147DE8|nr:TRAP transporter large permease subunit [uncultured Paracoccus sp.]